MDDSEESEDPPYTPILQENDEAGVSSSVKRLREGRRLTVLAKHGYKVLGSVGGGTYATVKVAYSEKHQHKVAVKIISKNKADADYLKKFLPREVEIMFKLKHPNIIEVYQTIDTPNRTYIIMELAEKGDVLAVVSHRPVKETQARDWFGQLLDGIEYCHSQSIVHRDIKCTTMYKYIQNGENLLLDANNTIKITDFSFSKNAVDSSGDDELLSSTYCGSYAYVCPEILQGTPYDPFLADIWSMGIVLYMMVYGYWPYDPSDTKVLALVVQRPPSFPPTPVISTECQQLIRKMLVLAEYRVTLQDIRNDPWFLMNLEDSPGSIQEESQQQTSNTE